ncbi:MAG: hypothetical protein R2748_26555 [Bryobacterales bacterium]
MEPRVLTFPSPTTSAEWTPAESLRAAGVDPARPDSIPFCAADATAGSETELQVAVHGRRDTVDLARTIESSSFFENVVRRAEAGDLSPRAVSALENWLDGAAERSWDNSWVRFPLRFLRREVAATLAGDLAADKSNPNSTRRADVDRFFTYEAGEEHVRIPISYLLKLALVDALDRDSTTPYALLSLRTRLTACFLNDNTSPETVSFHTSRLRAETGGGLALARETARRFLLTQLLVAYANDAFELARRGQRALVFASPHPPVRQRRLNDCVSDAFYRELFMSPCLSGWDRGEAKRDYMALCHQTLSRSQLNAVGKLREAGVVTRNLVVLPNTSNVSLANNGVHVSLGSERLTAALSARDPAFTPEAEKRVGDLVIKIVEHFLPLFVGTYSAAPYRFAFEDLHPETALGFLPHELAPTHVRMIWRRWRGKARTRILGNPVSPFGPRWLDRSLATVFGLKGDLAPDFRLVDYLVAPASTERSPALDGRVDNDARLLADLDSLGVFDARMPLYMLYRQREFRSRGYTGFEGRHYSLFPSFGADMAPAVSLQALVTAFAFQLVASGAVRHSDIPDRPFVESERRHIFFGAAIGLPTFYVDAETENRFLARVARRAKRTRSSRRYPGRLRLYHHEYRLALLETLELDAPALIEAMGMGDTLAELRQRLEDSSATAAAKLIDGALVEVGAKRPLDSPAEDFNLASERFYAGKLRLRQLAEAFEWLEQDVRRLSDERLAANADLSSALAAILDGQSASEYLERVRADVLAETLPAEELRRLVALVAIVEGFEAETAR